MKEYLIYQKDKFIGHCSDKEMVNKFLSSRKGNFHIVKVKESKIPDLVKCSVYFDNSQLVYYEGYSKHTDYPVFIYEQEMLEHEMCMDSYAYTQTIKQILEKIKYLKLNDEETALIIDSLVDSIKLIEDVAYGSHEIIYDDIFKIEKYMRYLLEKQYYKKTNTHKGVT